MSLLRPPQRFLAFFGWMLGLSLSLEVGAGVVITEFMAENSSGLQDEDGDHSDWIEISNPDSVPAELEGWRLTDNADNLSKWKFPGGVQIPALGRLIVFASGKDRKKAGSPLHTNFNLRKEGEYLALYQPTGSVPTTAFQPAYPPQYTDVSFGAGLRLADAPLIALGSPARIQVLEETNADRSWTGSPGNEPFPDQGWIEGTTSAGYDDLSADLTQNLLGYWNFDDVQSPKVARDESGHDYHGTLIGPAAFSAPGGGRTGQPRDRALILGKGNNGAGVRVDAASRGAFDLLQTVDRVTVSLWAWGGPEQPAVNSVFWFDAGATAGDSRNIMAHLPWSDGVIYFDTAGCCAADTRISRQETDTTKWRGQWNHYVFLKDGPRKEIWQNGLLWHSGSAAIPLKAIKALWLGSAVNGSASYPGKLDDVAVWASALARADIGALAAGVSPRAIGSYRPLIGTDLTQAMRGTGSVARMRIPFTVPEGPAADILLLKLQYDDGFSAWLNGVEIVSQNVPVRRSRTKSEGVQPVTFTLSGVNQLLRPGTNMLAIEGVNDDASGSDFLLNVELRAATALQGRYFTSSTPLEANGAGVGDFTAEPTITPGRGFYEGPVAVTLACLTPGAWIRYTLDGSLPTLTHGTQVESTDPRSGPSMTFTVERSQAIRAQAFHEDYQPSKVATHTYLFAGVVEKQAAAIPGYPATWGVYGAYGPKPGQPVPADYEMDPEIVRGTAPGYSVRDAILSLPAVCISTDVPNLFDPVSGIYANSASQGTQWVRPASAELVFPDGKAGFQIDAGVRIHGGLSRQHWHARKHSFRLNFQREFGPARLHFPLFEDTRVRSFDELTLRASSTDGWAVEDAEPWTRPKATYMRDPWMKDTQETLGWPCGHSRYVHLFLNGLYWGQYNLAERTEAAWLAENFGGAPEDYDIIKDGGEVESGSKADWDAMIALAESGLSSDTAYWRLQGRKVDGARDPALPVYLDVDNLIDYMILHIYSGAIDWPNHNWWSARRRGGSSEGFRFFTWDQEISNISLTATATYTGEAFEAVSGPRDSPAFLYAKLRANRQFRARLATRAVALTTGFGILTPPQNAARWERRQAEIDQSIVAESARWGDSRQTIPLKRSDWLKEMSWMRASYWPRIHAIAVGRFRAANLYTPSSAPTVLMTPPGGMVSPGARVTLSGGPNIYFTTNGLNPISPQGMPLAGAALYAAPVAINGPTQIRAQRAVGNDWSAVAVASFLQTTDVAPAAALVVSEIHYHPETNEAEEFVEVQNRSTTQHAILGGARISGGIDFVFPNAWVLPPGERAVVVRDLTAFEARYGTGKRVAGTFAGMLANEGEWIHLIAPSGQTLERFRYQDAQPWPAWADGGGRSLTLVQSSHPLDPADPRSWRASVAVGGTPGWDDGAPFGGVPDADADADGLSAVAEYYFGTSDVDAESVPSRAVKVVVETDGSVSLALTHRLEADQVEAFWESSPDLERWETVTHWPQPLSTIVEGSETLRWQAGFQDGTRRFYRLQLRLR